MFDKQRHAEYLERARTERDRQLAKAGADGLVQLQLLLKSEDPKAYYRSANLKGLRVLTLPELKLGEVHYGRVLYGRLSAKPFQMTAVHTILEDEFGRGIRLSVFDAVPPLASAKQLAAAFPVGVEVAIKEPYFKCALDGDTTIRVDNPANFVLVPEIEKDLKKNEEKDVTKNKKDVAKKEKNVEGLQRSGARGVDILEAMRCEGNKLFREENWHGALQMYVSCIGEACDMSDATDDESEKPFCDSVYFDEDDDYETYLNEILGGKDPEWEAVENVVKLAFSEMAEVQLRLGRFEAALSSVEEALKLEPSHLKSLCRKGRAAMEMGLDEKACEAFVAALEQCPHELTIQENLRLCRGRLAKSQTKGPCTGGEDKVLMQSSKDSEHVEYLGPVEILRVRYGDGRRGLFATEPLKTHKVFLVNNAIVMVKKHPEDPRAIFDMPSCSVGSSDDSRKPSSLARDHDVLVHHLQEAAASSKRSMAQLYSLASAGNEELAIPRMQLFHPESEWIPPAACDLAFDADRIKEIVCLNSFVGGHRDASSPSGKNVEDQPASAGLWILPSFINHSCVPNSIHMSTGTAKYARATRDIGVGEELTISYLNNLYVGHEDRAQKLSFQCRCERCSLENQLDAEFSKMRARLAVLVQESKDEFASWHGTVFEPDASREAVARIEDMCRSMSLKMAAAAMPSKNKKGGTQAGSVEANLESVKHVYPPTSELASIADRVETKLSSMTIRISPREQGWVRAGFLPAYLAKYQLAKVLGADASAKIEPLKLIVGSMMSVQASASTLTMAHLLLFEMKERYSRKSKTYKTIKELVMQVLYSLHADSMLSAGVFGELHANDPEFDYSKFTFTSELKPMHIFILPGKN